MPFRQNLPTGPTRGVPGGGLSWLREPIAPPAGMTWNQNAAGGWNAVLDPAQAPAHISADPQQLAADTNLFMTGQARQPFEMNLPGYSDLISRRSDVTGDLLSGQVPQDVVNQIMQASAERGVVTGMPGSPAVNASYLRNLGLTSMGLQQQGMANLSQGIADTPVPELFNPASLYVPERAAFQELMAAQGGNPWTPPEEPRPTNRLGDFRGLMAGGWQRQSPLSVLGR